MTIEQLVRQGFQGFVPISVLRDGAHRELPSCSGVYAIVRQAETAPVFLERSPGGWFKGKDPTVSAYELKQKWVDASPVLYYGKANVLSRRIKQYLDFGAGKPIGHWGGRLIWQVEASDEFEVAWMPCENPRGVESSLIQAFLANHGKLPFANLVG